LVWISDLPVKNIVLARISFSCIFTMLAGCVPSSAPTGLRIVFLPTSKPHASASKSGKPFVLALRDSQTPSGKWRYDEGVLSMLGLLHVNGRFRIYTPQ
jgi:hypothetical protein